MKHECSTDHPNTLFLKWKLAGAHVHIRVYVNGAFCGSFAVRDSEWPEVQGKIMGIVIQEDV